MPLYAIVGPLRRWELYVCSDAPVQTIMDATGANAVTAITLGDVVRLQKAFYAASEKLPIVDEAFRNFCGAFEYNSIEFGCPLKWAILVKFTEDTVVGLCKDSKCLHKTLEALGYVYSSDIDGSENLFGIAAEWSSVDTLHFQFFFKKN